MSALSQAKDARALHGTESAYKHGGCRCGRCRAAAALARRLRRAGKGPGNPAGQQVHSARGYKFWGCRCDVCRAANTEMCRTYRERARARRNGADQKDSR